MTLAGLALPGAVHGADAYDVSSRRLTIPALNVGGETLSNVSVTVSSVISGPSGSFPAATVDTLDPARGLLTIPSVIANGHAYHNVVATVGGVVSVGGASGGDVYDGAYLHIPVVAVGGAIYDNVVATLGSVVDEGGGLPQVALDTYDPSTGQLKAAVAVDAVHGRVYTNAVVTIARIVSIGGSGSDPELVITHAQAQTALGFGLAQVVLQSQLLIVAELSGQVAGCAVLKSGGSAKAGIGSPPTSATIYFDNACTQPFMVADGTLTVSGNGNLVTVPEAVSFYSVSGTHVGDLMLNVSLGQPTSAAPVTLYSLGTYTPTTGVRSPVQFGLDCSIPANIATTSGTVTCDVGVAQDFPSLGTAFGSVSPLTFNAPALNSNGLSGFGFSDTPIQQGPLGSLSLTAPGGSSLTLSGGASRSSFYGGATLGAYALFPPTPTEWYVRDSGTEQDFIVGLDTSPATGYLMSEGKPLTTTILVSASTDKSGTGSITWSDGSVSPVNNWTLGATDTLR
jgi:hypothetical protein